MNPPTAHHTRFWLPRPPALEPVPEGSDLTGPFEAPDPARGLPQAVQNREPAITDAPQEEQDSSERACPHDEQNFPEASAPHFEHFIQALALNPILRVR
jgi:hypothetical protein